MTWRRKEFYIISIRKKGVIVYIRTLPDRCCRCPNVVSYGVEDDKEVGGEGKKI